MGKTLLEKYENTDVLRALVNLIPTIGGSLDILLSIKGSKWREERLKTFLSNLDNRVYNLENQEIITQISESEEFYDLIVHAMNSVVRTRHKEKIDCYVNILSNSLQKPKSKISSELLISTLDNITIDEIAYLSELKNNSFQIKIEIIEGKKVIWSKYRHQLESTGDTNINSQISFLYNIDLVWKLLSDRNIITIETKKDFKNLEYTYSTGMSSIRSQVLSTETISYNITEFGQEFISWVLE